MDDKEILILGKLCAQHFKDAWMLNKKIEDELVRRFGFLDVEDYIEKTGTDFENDVLIDSLQMNRTFSMTDWKLALSMQKEYVRRAGESQ